MNQQQMIKFIVCGNSAVGKTSILLRFTKDTFNESLNATIGVDILVKRIEYQGATYKLCLGDTSGQERYSALSNLYFRGAKCICFCYAINDKDSFVAIQRWVENAKRNCDNPNFIGVLIGNKIDLEDERVVSYEDGADLAQREGFLFLECSAKTAAGIDDVFEDAFTAVMTQQAEAEAKQQQFMMQQSMYADVLNNNTNTQQQQQVNKVNIEDDQNHNNNGGYGCC